MVAADGVQGKQAKYRVLQGREIVLRRAAWDTSFSADTVRNNAMSDDFFAPPPFDPSTARATLVRALRDLKLAERNGAFELNGQPVVKVRIEGTLLKLDVAKKPSRSPEWEHADAGDHARPRRFIDDVNKRVARWNEGRDAD
jgi:hypothetical protein